MDTGTESGTTSPARASGRRLALECALVAAAATVLLWLHAGFFSPERLHVSGRFVDQGNYISTARVLVDTGELRCGLIFPAHLERENWRPYMPGHYLSLALSYAVFGYGVFTSLLPNLVAFVLATTATFLIGRELYGLRAGLLAGALFALFPGNLTYAFTAMAELTFTAAGALALAAFLRLPERWRAEGGMLLLALPFLFRETGALLVLPMLGLLLQNGRGKKNLRNALLLGLLAVGFLYVVNVWQTAQGKGAVPLSWVTEGKFNYMDAFAPEPARLSPGEWIAALFDNAGRNAAETAEQFRDQGFQMSVVGHWTIVGLIGVSLCAGVLRRKRESFPLGVAALGLVLLAMVYFLYDVKGQKGMRSMLFAFPCLAVVAGSAFERVFLGRGPGGAGLRAVRYASGALVTLVLLAGAHLTTVLSGRELSNLDGIADSATRVLRELHAANPDLAVVAPHEMMMDFIVSAYPTPVSFPPANEQTLELLDQKHPIGTLVFNKRFFGTDLSKEALQALSLRRYYPDIHSGERVYVAFQKKR